MTIAFFGEGWNNRLDSINPDEFRLEKGLKRIHARLLKDIDIVRDDDKRWFINNRDDVVRDMLENAVHQENLIDNASRQGKKLPPNVFQENYYRFQRIGRIKSLKLPEE